MENLLETYGFDLRKVIEDARANGNENFAVELERNIGNLQACFDVLAEKHSTTAGENVWNVDVEYLRSKLK